jgi:hypothetical protein
MVKYVWLNSRGSCISTHVTQVSVQVHMYCTISIQLRRHRRFFRSARSDEVDPHLFSIELPERTSSSAFYMSPENSWQKFTWFFFTHVSSHRCAQLFKRDARCLIWQLRVLATRGSNHMNQLNWEYDPNSGNLCTITATRTHGMQNQVKSAQLTSIPKRLYVFTNIEYIWVFSLYFSMSA